MSLKQPIVYAVQHKDEKVRAESRSGGVFTAISDQVLANNGVVYGCILTEDFQAVHVRAENTEERNKMRGSKYIQSKMGDTFKNIKEDLDKERLVLFSGTGCQVAGLKNYLGKKYSNLICVDIVCHGVPSKKVWKEYLKWQEKKKKSKVMSVDFRNKKDFGWTAHVETILMENGTRISSEIFKNLFYGHTILRPSCYECKYKSIHRNGDISIADYWRIERAASEFDDDKGTSLVLVNTEAGEQLFEEIKNKIRWKRTRIEDSMQQPLKAPFPKPENREQFWNDFRTRTFSYVAKKYGGYGIRNKRIFRRIKRKLNGILKR